MDKKKNFIDLNEGFKCEECDKIVGTATKTCRNHCTKCLHSKHVDEKIPGDRKSECKGIMEPISLEIKKNKGYLISHKCKKCGKIKKNKASEDDNFDSLIELLKKTNDDIFKNS